MTDTTSIPETRLDLPGRPTPYVLRKGEGEKSLLFDNAFTMLLSADETEGQYSAAILQGGKGDRIPAHLHQRTHEFFYVIEGAITVWTDDQEEHHAKTLIEPGDFAFIPANIVHAYRVESATKVFGAGTGDFFRFFRAAGAPTGETGLPHEVYVPPMEQLIGAGQQYDVHFMPEFQFRD
ncbi:quercetin 2,3-dioxygenase [Microbacterium sp. NPDC077184]|uniref:quercetin 2,3-dioxygenase n=1 Tax=Microbacterium sp. NPDC077184 TaxID=3154764 RepID=UPI003420E194